MRVKEKILLVDDEPDILEFLKYNLEKSNYHVFTADNGEEGVKIALSTQPDLILIDVMMPKMDGMEVCSIIREEKNIEQPIIAFLTSRSEDYSQIAGFEVGADDYITKPIRPRVLISRIEALLRRKSKPALQKISDSSLYLDRERFLLIKDGVDLQLPKKEFELLELLVNKPGKVFTRDEILGKVWGNDTIVGERTIDVHIRKLREKIGDDYIRTIKGVGYTYNEV
ncbi:MAG: response regulator transcription factor [Crocinitomicaceae bacterium]|nr:response regulator transcription factor [Crocinitomicaceae bacterium]